MTNVSAPGKVPVRQFLRQKAVEALRGDGWRVVKKRADGKSSLWTITKGGESATATIRTSQDAWFAFPRNDADDGWSTLELADYVVVASLTEKEGAMANIHLMPADDVRARFDRAYEARKAAGYNIPRERGIWISLYDEEQADPVRLVGAGAGLAHKAIAKNITVLSEPDADDVDEEAPVEQVSVPSRSGDDSSLTIPEAKRRLALTFGVSPDQIKITVEG